MANKKISGFPNKITPASGDKFLLEDVAGNYYYVTKSQLQTVIASLTLSDVLTNGNSTNNLDIVSPNLNTLRVSDNQILIDFQTIGSLSIDALTDVTLTGANKLTINSPLIEVSQDPTTALGVATKGFVEGLADSKSRNIVKSITDGTNITGTTSNTLSDSQLIAANSIVVGDIIDIYSRIRYTGVAGNKTARFYFNTSASLSGATLAATYTAGAGALSIDMSRHLAIKSATNTETIGATTTILPDDSQASAAHSSLNIDWTVDQYFIVAIQLASGSDAGIVSYVKIRG